ncbi:MAG: 30S ribosomal protein S27ae [Candidatus Aenigmarchaeota archaeon]|nr:30S ribosomal protein S27ae [Candidatus Aenigmarchaeota archaeon]
MKVSSKYKIENGKLVRLGKVCPRCGDGIFMAEHKEKDRKIRYFCGKCKLTIWENPK